MNENSDPIPLCDMATEVATEDVRTQKEDISEQWVNSSPSHGELAQRLQNSLGLEETSPLRAEHPSAEEPKGSDGYEGWMHDAQPPPDFGFRSQSFKHFPEIATT